MGIFERAVLPLLIGLLLCACARGDSIEPSQQLVVGESPVGSHAQVGRAHRTTKDCSMNLAPSVALETAASACAATSTQTGGVGDAI